MPPASGNAPSLTRLAPCRGQRCERSTSTHPTPHLARIWHAAMSPARSYPEPALRIRSLTWGVVAEREGFEPPGRLHARLLSRQLQSTRLCHRSQPVRRRDDRPAPVRALLFKYPEPSAARIYSAPRPPHGTSCTTCPRPTARAQRG